MKKQELILKWLDKEFGDLTKVVKGDKTFYIDDVGKIIFYYYQKLINGILYVNNDRVLFLIESIFGLEELETEFIFEVWLKETYNLRGFIMVRIVSARFSQLEQNYNLN
jgi:hypothetical protein